MHSSPEWGIERLRRIGLLLARLLVVWALILAPLPSVAEKKSPAAAGEKGKADEPAPDTWHTSTVSRHERGVMVVNYWSKGAKFRAETIVGGRRINSLVNGDRYYIFDSVTGAGLSVQRSEKAIAEDATRGRPFGIEYDEVIKGGGEQIRGGEIPDLNFKFELYQLTDDSGRKQVLVTNDELHLPIRIETWIRQAGKTSIIEYSGWQRGLAISDSFFEPPVGIDFQKLGYETYVRAITRSAIGPAPVFYRNLLHGSPD